MNSAISNSPQQPLCSPTPTHPTSNVDKLTLAIISAYETSNKGLSGVVEANFRGKLGGLGSHNMELSDFVRCASGFCRW